MSRKFGIWGNFFHAIFRLNIFGPKKDPFGCLFQGGGKTNFWNFRLKIYRIFQEYAKKNYFYLWESNDTNSFYCYRNIHTVPPPPLSFSKARYIDLRHSYIFISVMFLQWTWIVLVFANVCFEWLCIVILHESNNIYVISAPYIPSSRGASKKIIMRV